MAWPCITRACCINRFWSELDKADIAVPLVFAKYSDVADMQHLSHQPQPKQKTSGPIVAIETQPHLCEEAPPATCDKDGSASVTRQDFRAWKVRPEPSCKPKNEYHPTVGPFDTETQYQKDYKPWPIPKKGDHPWIPKPSPSAASRKGVPPGGKKEQQAEAESGVEKSEIEEKVQEKESKEAVKKTREKSAERKDGEKTEEQLPSDATAERKGREAADALNRQIKEVVSTGSSYRNEFKAYKDVKPVKSFKASSQYQPPTEEANRETSYSATFKGEQGKAQPSDNKQLERRRIRSLYSEPGQEQAKVDKPASRSKPKKTPAAPTSGKTAKKSKEKQVAGTQSAKKKSPAGGLGTKPEGGVSKKSKEMRNRLAEAKQ